MMGAVITQKDARRVTRAKNPPQVPVEYNAAVNALEACMSLDEAKHWSTKADALAAWAKMYRDDVAGAKAKKLKLHAYRRMGILAAELRPPKRKYGGGSVPGSGPRQLLLENGLTTTGAEAARTLALLSKQDFESLLKHPVAPTTARHWVRDVTIWHEVQRAAISLRSVTRRHLEVDVVDALSDGEIEAARALVTELVDWLDRFEQRLPKKLKERRA